MPPIVVLHVIIALDFAVGFGRDHSGCTALVEVVYPTPQSVARSFKPPFWKFEAESRPNRNPECPQALVHGGKVRVVVIGPQWTRAKSFDVVGPVIETEVDWRTLTVQVFVNERERQSYPAADMIHSPEQIISRLSQDMTLNPGDLIACGTSVGARPVKPGMTVDVVFEGIGRIGVTMLASPTGCATRARVNA